MRRSSALAPTAVPTAARRLTAAGRALLPVLGWLLACTSTPLLAADAPKPVITVTVTGEHVEYDQDSGQLVVHGRVTITAQSDRPGLPTVSLASGELEADLVRGHLVAHEGVRLLSQQFAMRGEKVDLDLARAEFQLTRGAAAVSALNPLFPDLPVRGYLFAQEISKRADVVYMIEGRLTTCDHVPPHYSIGVSQFTVDTRSLTYSLRNGRMQLYGWHLALPGHYAASAQPKQGTDPIHQMLPGYSSYDGLYLPVTVNLAPRSRDWEVTLATRLGTRFRFPGELRVERESGRDDFSVVASRREEVTWDLSRGSYLNRVPAVRWERHLTDSRQGDQQLDLALESAYIEEKPVHEASRSALRGRVELAYSPLPRARRQHRGLWVGVDGFQSFYDTGDALTDLQAEVGWGAAFGDKLSGAAWFVHHETFGATPFRFDDVYADNEIFGEAQGELGHDWFARAYTRFDTDDWHLRDLHAGLHRRVHCLTWGITYDRARERWGLALDLSGVTGGTPPYGAKPLVAPEEVPPLPPVTPGPGATTFQLTLPGGAP